ncbi:uncharacterized protein LOC126560064 [Anopheles maculipalpis]|uniref:uncharacterized protein LOC126560064 n=1 Tax=Anopheles maculipalpis TaxID=1496333 RepID=UPI002158AD1C|nr:uncharacterized protein LOC126560064 [Anopheles maculipalpis]
MDKIWRVYLACLLMSVTFGSHSVMADTDEYEYYYEEVNKTSMTENVSSTPDEQTTVTIVPIALEEQVVTEASTVSMDLDGNTENPNITMISAVTSQNGTAMQTDWSTTTAVEGENVNLSNDVRRNDVKPTRLNGTRPTKFTNIIYKTTRKPKSNNPPPAIVLNIYTGMYGMDSRVKNRASGNVGGRNNYWPRAQSPLQGWYGMYNWMPKQSFTPVQQRPIYRGRGQQAEYDNTYNGFNYQKATKPRRNNQQNRGTELDQQASMAVFNFLLQALGQRSGSSPRMQTQGQQGSRRKT